MDPELHQQLDPSPYRTLQPQAPLHAGAPPHLAHHQQHPHAAAHAHNHALAAAAGQVDLSALQEHNESVFHQNLQQQLQGAAEGHPHAHAHGYPAAHHFERNHVHRPLQVQSNGSPHTPQQQQHGHTPYGMLGSGPIQHSSISRLQQDDDIFGPGPGGSPGDGVGSSNGTPEQKGGSHLHTKIVIDPPNLGQWRQKLFDVNEMITLSEEDFETYFPHVDNVYSHRSTQRYKKKPFVSHYWDCRLKGRPPGTPKSDDPNKKKRKRTARERDLCDVKIKITEYFPGAMLQPDFQPDGHMQHGDTTQSNGYYNPGHNEQPMYPGNQHVLPMNTSAVAPGHPGANGARFYTIQRVNGNGGNGKGDGVPGPHKHDLAHSDNIKKNSVQREILKREKEEKKTQRSNGVDTRNQKQYHKKATGTALATVKKHAKEHDLKLFGSCFCPWVQRVWIAMEAKGIQYQYIEVDPYKKPQSLLEVNPRGLVPAIRHGNWACGESTVLMEYLEDLGIGRPLLPTDSPDTRATTRYWADHVNRTVIPAFYAVLQAQDFAKQTEHAQKLHSAIDTLVEACHPEGPFFAGAELSWVDIFFAPWMLRFTKVLKPYRNWPDPVPNTRWQVWMDAIAANEHVKCTTSNDELYIDSYERYAQNRPGTSMIADAVNAGMGLP